MKKIWNYETCYEAALKCKNSRDMYLRFGSAYNVACKNGWVKEYTWFDSGQKEHGYWDKKHCLEAAKECKTRSEMIKRYNGAYHVAIDNGWDSEYTWFKERKHLPNYWNDEKHCLEAAKKCKTVQEFIEKYHSAYNASRRNGWYDTYDFLERDKLVYKDKVYAIYAYHFEEHNAIYIGLTCELKARDSQHRNAKKKTSVMKFAIENNCEIPQQIVLEQNLNMNEAGLAEEKWVNHYKSLDYKVLNKAKCGKCSALGSVVRKWSREKCYNEALKFKTKRELQDNNKTVYNTACKNGWLSDYTWMPKNARWQQKKAV